jgi:DNA-binding transcriptional MerR regulator
MVYGPTDMTHTVGEVARLAGVTVRTLHHYDEIGLLQPVDRTGAAYRIYDDGDLARLQQVLFYRELGLSLQQIARAMTGEDFDRRRALHDQRELLRRKVRRLEKMIEAIGDAITAEETGIGMTNEDMFEVFGDFDPAEYEDEVKERWGDTDAYRESSRRAKRYTKADWQAIKAGGEPIVSGLAAALRAGTPADDATVMDLADAHRLEIDKWFYPCSPEMHAALGEMYVADPRFTAYWDQFEAGLAMYVRDAFAANARRA